MNGTRTQLGSSGSAIKRSPCRAYSRFAFPLNKRLSALVDVTSGGGCVQPPSLRVSFLFFSPLKKTKEHQLSHPMALFEPSARVEAVRGRNKIAGFMVDKSRRIYIANIPDVRIAEEGGNALKAEFEAFGPVESYRMFTEKTGRFIGSALCTFRNAADATAAVEKMNGLVAAEGTDPLQVSVSNEHGVVLLHQEARGAGKGHFFRPDGRQEERWSHDKFELLAEGKDDGEVFGSRRRPWRGRGRGRGGAQRQSGADRVEEAFNRYIQERDEAKNAPPPAPSA